MEIEIYIIIFAIFLYSYHITMTFFQKMENIVDKEILETQIERYNELSVLTLHMLVNYYVSIEEFEKAQKANDLIKGFKNN